MDHDHAEHGNSSSGRGKWILIGFLAFAAFFLWTEHRVHVLGILPYVVFLACPLMHLFHHHGHHHRHETRRPPEDGRPTIDRREVP